MNKSKSNAERRMILSKVIATGAYLPGDAVKNERLIRETAIESSDEWIVQRTGIKKRHFASVEESVSDLATKSVEKLLHRLDTDIRQEIDLIIVATMSSQSPTPSVASQVQAALGIEESWAFDVSGACSGFVMALELAEKLTNQKRTGYSLVIGAEKMSNILNFEDRSSSVLFGDGAGAVLIKNDGEGLKNYTSELKSIPDPKNSIHLEAQELMTMDGRAVFNFVLRKVIPSLAEFVEKQTEPFDYLISHQANYRLIEMIAKKLKVSLERVPTNIDEVANTSAASIPILLNKLVNEKKIKLDGNQKLVLIGYGGGLAWGQISLMV